MSEVMYIQCPNCKKGWYGEIENDTVIKTENGVYVDLTKPCHCFDCGHDYVPISREKTTVIMKMWDFIAKALTTCKG